MIKNGGPAFPVYLKPDEYYAGEGDPDGMSLRDWFATHASQEDIKHHLTWHDEGMVIFRRTREQARYHYADAMIEAREFGDEA